MGAIQVNSHILDAVQIQIQEGFVLFLQKNLQFSLSFLSDFMMHLPKEVEMLQLKKITKKYITSDLMQTALNEVSLTLRDNEFVAILGPSGSGKTTMLNIIGGLDRYDSGDLIVNDISTKNYTEKDWDSYRNHAIGFVFQSYNLIMHQSILSNVELALTLSGVSPEERTRRATEALKEVGLGDHIHKKPTQLSGGQMQRVAIARALINDPEILLADEPTGALDSETSIQVMELLKKVAKDRLVVMVTHNPELAEEYAMRIVKLKDGRIIDDSDPVESIDESHNASHENMGKSSMSFWTAMQLSFNNIKTKKKRTLLTAFAGSIGIIGIALIMSLSNGVNNYIDDIQKETMTSYPITIQSQTISLTGAMEENREKLTEEVSHDTDAVYSNSTGVEMASNISTSFTENNLTAFKTYLESDDNEISKYVGEEGIQYGYDIAFNVYTYDPNDQLVNADGVLIDEESDTSDGFSSSSSSSSSNPMSSIVSMMTSSSSNPGSSIAGGGLFDEMLPGQGDSLVSEAILDSYDVLAGEWPTEATDVVLVLDQNNEVSLLSLYELGMLPSEDYKTLMDDLEDGKDVDIEEYSWSYEDLMDQELYLIPASDMYIETETKSESGVLLYEYVGDSASDIENLLEDAYVLHISGIVKSSDDSDSSLITGTIGYTTALSDELIDHINNSAVVKAQEDNPDVNILTGYAFEAKDDEAKIEDARTYIKSLDTDRKAGLARTMVATMDSSELMSLMSANSDISSASSADMNAAAAASGAGISLSDLTNDQLASMLDTVVDESMEDETLLDIYDNYVSSGSYDDNLQAFGSVSLDAPGSISIYADSFENKEKITSAIEDYNKTASEEDQISYTDYVGLLMSSVTTIINIITYVLIGFVGLSLVVSSIMIGIITYISVLERTKEIGILRAIGASKRNISQVFDAETLMIGLCSGLLGVVISYLLIIPMNSIIHMLSGNTVMNASLPIGSAILLVLLSMGLTFLGGLIPARAASKKDPVAALRTE